MVVLNSTDYWNGLGDVLPFCHNVLDVVEVKAVNTEALLMQNDSCIDSQQHRLGGFVSVCVKAVGVTRDN